jgi:hypothetical protein
MMGTMRRGYRNVKQWRNAAMALRWTAAGMMEAAKNFHRLKVHKQLPNLRASLVAHAAKHLDPSSRRTIFVRWADQALRYDNLRQCCEVHGSDCAALEYMRQGRVRDRAERWVASERRSLRCCGGPGRRCIVWMLNKPRSLRQSISLLGPIDYEFGRPGALAGGGTGRHRDHAACDAATQNSSSNRFLEAAGIQEAHRSTPTRRWLTRVRHGGSLTEPFAPTFTDRNDRCPLAAAAPTCACARNRCASLRYSSAPRRSRRLHRPTFRDNRRCQ